MRERNTVDAVQEEDSSSLNVNLFITGINIKEASIEVLISNGASFFISDADYARYAFSKGDPVSSEIYEALERGHRFILCRQKALDLLSFSEHSSFTLSVKLRQRGFEPAVVSDVIAMLEEKKYIDDCRFGELWVRSRLKKNPCGRSALVSGLRAKGLSAPLAEQVIDELDDDVMMDGACRAYKKIASRKGMTNDKIIGQLLRRGYSMNMIREIMARGIYEKEE